MTSPSPGIICAGDDEDEVARAQMRAGNLFGAAVRPIPYGGRLGLGAAQRVGLRLAAAFRHGLGEVGEQHREPEPERDLQIEAERVAVRGDVAEQIERRDDAADLDHEHDGILHHRAWIQLGQRIEECAADDLWIPERAFACACHESFFFLA